MNSKLYNIFIIILLLASANQLFAQQDSVNPNGYNVFHYPNGFKLSEGNLENGKPNGYWITYYVNGNKKSEGNRKNFMLDSLWIFYAANGDTTETIFYVQDKKNGFDTQYFTRLDSGVNTIKSKELYVDNQKQGFSFYYYTNGQLHQKIKYKDNYKNGVGYEYSLDGTLIAIEQYRNNNLISRRAVNRIDHNGHRTGVWVQTFPNGKIKSETNYIDDLPNGTAKEFSPTGKIIKIETYANGIVQTQINNPTAHDTLKLKKLQIKQDFYPNGRLKYIKTYQDSIPFGTHIYYDENGNITKAQTFNEFGILSGEGRIDTLSKKQGEWTFYYDDGSVFSKGQFIDSLKTGTWVYFYENGKLRQKGNFKDNYPEGKWFWYYDNDSLLRETNYTYGELNGFTYELSPSGDTIVKGTYNDGSKHGVWTYQIGDEYTKGEYYLGRKKGKWITYYFPKMTIKCKDIYVDNKKNGKHRCYYENKKIKELGQYQNDKKTGKWTYYNNDGNIDFTAEYSRGILVKVNDKKIE